MTSGAYAVKELPYDIAAYLVTNETIDISIDTRLRVASIRIENGTGNALIFTSDAIPSGGSVPTGVNIPPGASVRSFPQGVWNLRLQAAAGATVRGAVRIHLSELELPDTSSEYGVGFANVFSDQVTHTNAAFGTGTTTAMSNFVPLDLRFRMVAWRLQLAGYSSLGAAQGASHPIGSILTGMTIGMNIGLWLRHEPGNVTDAGSEDSGMVYFPEPGIVSTQDLQLNIEQSGVGTAPGSVRFSVLGTVFGVLEPAA